MRHAALGLCVFATTACTSEPARQHVLLPGLSFDAPGDWRSQDTQLRGLTTSVWTPADDNDRKESVTIMRSERSEAVAQAGVAAVADLLVHSQVPGAQVSGPIPIVTMSGLKGMRVHVAYKPPGMAALYDRTQVVLIDGTALIHVMYTARVADPSPNAMSMVLDTIRHEGA